MRARIQFDMRVLNDTVPVEIEGTCNQQTFYYRARHGRWCVTTSVLSHANGDEPIADGECDIDEQTDLGFALARIHEHVITPAAERR